MADEPTDERPRIDPRRLFADEHGFFRSSKFDTGIEDPFARITIRGGGAFSEAEADSYARRFFDILADGRPVAEHDDVVEFVDRNGLLLLLGPREEDKFLKLVGQMPADRAERWFRLLGGQTDDVAFSEAVQEEEDRLVREARAGRNRAIVFAIGGVVAVVAVIVTALALRDGSGSAPVGRIFFGVDAEADGPKLIEGDAPAVNRQLVARLDAAIAVRSGAGSETERVTIDPDPALLPFPAGALTATLFTYGGRGQVVFVGPAGFAATACLQVSAVSAALRPFDTVRYEGTPGACPDSVVGRPAVVGCSGDTAVMVELQFPEGEVDLEEGGTATIGAVRVLAFAKAPGFDFVSVRSMISVAAGTEAKVPRFGGESGESVSFDVTPEGSPSPVFGKCTLV